MDQAPRSGTLLLARVLLALLFIHGGYGKLFNIGGFAHAMAVKGMPLPGVFPYLGILIELIGGIVLLLGLRTRLLGILFALYTLATALIGHDFWAAGSGAQHAAMLVQFYKNLAIIGGFLLLSVTGGGAFSLDGWLGRESFAPIQDRHLPAR